ncbi:MAG: ATP-binding cassette domain-containing protein [Mycoplasmataceae bacterium]|jgi:energy-coupling factor transport system ATP-binding protein|nr:ATP-binding cassette domain-containing protein [Mycoplasmataceae bacterium]
MFAKKITSSGSTAPSTQPYAIQLENFTVKFNEKTDDELVLFNNVNYNFEAGKIHFIVGPSGCGKTVLISHFNGLLLPSSGKIAVLGEEIKVKRNKVKNVKSIRAKIGMVLQFAEYQLFKPTIERDIIFGPMNFGVKKDEAKDRAKKLIVEVGLDESFLPRNPFGLSGGQKRRIAIAGILAIDPDILVFDEPTAGLDPQGENDILNIIKELKKKGKTVFVVTHTMNHAVAIADNVVVINNGNIVKDGTIYEIFSDHQLIKNVGLSVPSIINTINLLVQNDQRFSQLLVDQPRSIEELVTCINRIIFTKKGGK